MLCELATTHAKDPLLLWLVLCIIGATAITLTSGVVFIDSYVFARYDRWVHKTNPQYPSVLEVRNEILATVRGIAFSTIPPVLTLYLAQRDVGYAYCGVANERYDVGWLYLIGTFLLSWLVSDCYEWYYHRLGHTSRFGWNVHKHHHVYHNPTPFAVIADEPMDQFMRALPLLAFPMTIPINMDMLFGMYLTFFYVYGIYLHWGHEFAWPDAHHPWLNTSFQHYIHHASSTMNRPYHTGFFFKAWDQATGSVWEKEHCLCAKCARERGERSLEAWKKVCVPSYRGLLTWQLWVHGETNK